MKFISGEKKIGKNLLVVAGADDTMRFVKVFKNEAHWSTLLIPSSWEAEAGRFL